MRWTSNKLRLLSQHELLELYERLKLTHGKDQPRMRMILRELQRRLSKSEHKGVLH